MLFFKLLVSTSLLFASALAIPTTTPVKRAAFDTTAASLDVQLCMYDDRLPAVHWGILIPNDPSMDAGCGCGFLDNFRGRWGVVTSRGCTWVGASGTTAFLEFWTAQRLHCVGRYAGYPRCIPRHKLQYSLQQQWGGVEPDISNLVVGSGGVGK